MTRRFRIVRRIVGGLLAFASLIFLGVGVLIRQQVHAPDHPEQLSCAEFLQRASGKAWIHAHGCKVDIFSQSFITVNGEIRYLVFPLLAPDDESDKKTRGAVAIGTPDLVELARQSQANGAPRNATLEYEAALEARVYHQTDWRGARLETILDRPGVRDVVVKGNKYLAPDVEVLIVDGGTGPDLQPAVVTAFVVAAVCAALGAWLIFG